MIDHITLQALKEALSEGRPDGSLTLREFGKILGRAVDRRAYSKSYVCRLLRGKEPISPRVGRAARVLMVGVAALDERSWMDPLPSFEGEPIKQLKEAREWGVGWWGLYVSNPEVRAFVDALVDIITRG